MTTIQITGTKRYDAQNYAEVSYKMTFTLPAIWGTGASPIAGLSIIVASFPDGFSTEVIAITGTVVTFSNTVSVPITVTLNQIKNGLITKYNSIRTQLDGLTLKTWDQVAGLTYDGTNWI